MPIRIGTFDHLNESDPPTIKLDMDELAKQIVSLNYGTVRFLAALARARRAHKDRQTVDDLAIGIENLLNQGFF